MPVSQSTKSLNINTQQQTDYSEQNVEQRNRVSTERQSASGIDDATTWGNTARIEGVIAQGLEAASAHAVIQAIEPILSGSQLEGQPLSGNQIIDNASLTVGESLMSASSESQTNTQSQGLLDAQAITASVEMGEFSHLPLWSSIKTEAIVPGMMATIDSTRSAFESLEKNLKPTWQELMLPLERLEHQLNNPMARLEHLKMVCYNEGLSQAIDEVQPHLVQLNTEMGQSQAVFKALTELNTNDQLTAPQKQAVINRLKAMKHQGVGLTGPDKTRFIEIKKTLEKLSTSFSNNLVEQAKIDRIKVDAIEQLKGIPAPVVEAAAKQAVEDGVAQATAEQGPWHFTVDATNYIAVMERCQNPEFREQFYRGFKSLGQSPGKDNRPVLKEILALKQEKARLLGFENAAQASLDVKMAPSVEAVDQLLEKLKQASLSVADKELSTLTAFAKTQDPNISTLQPWDISYWNEQYMQENFDLDQENIRQYLQVPRVMDSLFSLMHDLFGITVKPMPASYIDPAQLQGLSDQKVAEVPTWHKDVQFYAVEEKGQVIAGFFMDPYARSGEKQPGAWMDIVVDKSTELAREGQDTSIPVALFVLNARPPSEGKPGVFSLDEVETLFHEFGHALQHMLTRIKEGEVSGLNGIEWDAVEVASQFNENWVYRPEYLKTVSAHIDSGQPLDDETIKKIIDSRHYFAANATLRQLYFAKTDMRLHQEVAGSASDQQQDPFQIEKEVRQEMVKTPYLESETQLPAFGHIFAGGYSAGYYSYKWSEVIAADAFAAFEEAGLDNTEAVRAVAQRYRDTILAEGGSRPAQEIYRDFRGRDADPQALLRQQGLIG